MISSRTPDGIPGKCPVCQQEVVLQPSEPLADCPCPCCGTLIWPVSSSDELAGLFAIADELSPEKRKRVAEILANGPAEESLDRAEQVMELEDLMEVSIPDSALEGYKSKDEFWETWLERWLDE